MYTIQSSNLAVAAAPATNAFLSALGPDELALVRPHLRPATFEAGQYLHHLGDQLEDVIFPYSGIVAMTLPLPDHANVAAFMVGRDGVIGGCSAMTPGVAGADAEVYIAGQGANMPLAAFQSLLDQSASLRHHAAHFQSMTLAQAQQTAVCNAAHPVERRICRWLMEVHDRHEGAQIPLTQSTIAQMLGVRRTTVTLVAGHLEAAGMIRCRRGYMQVVDEEKLRRQSCSCYEDLRRRAAAPYAKAAEKPARVKPLAANVVAP
jgi:CRP-like cAMP-binding protein